MTDAFALVAFCLAWYAMGVAIYAHTRITRVLRISRLDENEREHP